MKEFKVTKKDVNFIQYRIILATRYLKPLFFKKPNCCLIVYLTIDDIFKENDWELNKIAFYDEYIDIIGTFNSEFSPKKIIRMIRKNTINALFGESNILEYGQPFGKENIDDFYNNVYHSNLINRNDLEKENYKKEVPNKSVWAGYTLITTDLELPHSRILNWLLAQSNFKALDE